jgi:flagellar hook-basal body complex protein FliE
MSSIAPISTGFAPIRGIEETAQPAAKVEGGESFGNFLSAARASETEATQASERFANGDPTQGIHEVMIATEKANIAVRYATTVKNKALEAYRELMNTQV